MKDEICNQISVKKSNLFSLSSFCGKREESIAQELYSALEPWAFENINYPGLFGWTEFKSDKFVKLKNGRAIIEVKKVPKNRSMVIGMVSYNRCCIGFRKKKKAIRTIRVFYALSSIGVERPEHD